MVEFDNEETKLVVGDTGRIEREDGSESYKAEIVAVLDANRVVAKVKIDDGDDVMIVDAFTRKGASDYIFFKAIEKVEKCVAYIYDFGYISAFLPVNSSSTLPDPKRVLLGELFCDWDYGTKKISNLSFKSVDTSVDLNNLKADTEKVEKVNKPSTSPKTIPPLEKFLIDLEKKLTEEAIAAKMRKFFPK